MKTEIHKSKHKPSMLLPVKDRRRRVIERLEAQVKREREYESDDPAIIAARPRMLKELATLKTRI